MISSVVSDTGDITTPTSDTTMTIDKIELVNAFEQWLDANKPTDTLDRTGQNARTASDLLSFLNEQDV